MFSGNRLIGWAWTARNHPEVDLRRWLCHYGACHISVRTQSWSSRTQIHTRYSATNVSIILGLQKQWPEHRWSWMAANLDKRCGRDPHVSEHRVESGWWRCLMLTSDPQNTCTYTYMYNENPEVHLESRLGLPFYSSCVISLLLLSHFSLSSLAMSHFPSHYFSLIWISQ